MMIMRSAGSEIDWQRLLWQVGRHRLALPLRDTLAYARDVLDAPVPFEVIQSLQQMPATDLEQSEYEARISPWAARGPWGEFRYKYQRYAVLTYAAGSPPSLLGFAKFLMGTWGLEHLWQLPLSAVGKVAYRLREMSAWYGRVLKARYLRHRNGLQTPTR
jgi:hypothetical protein